MYVELKKVESKINYLLKTYVKSPQLTKKFKDALKSLPIADVVPTEDVAKEFNCVFGYDILGTLEIKAEIVAVGTVIAIGNGDCFFDFGSDGADGNVVAVVSAAASGKCHSGKNSDQNK
jgi:hypothetical protein